MNFFISFKYMIDLLYVNVVVANFFQNIFQLIILLLKIKSVFFSLLILVLFKQYT